MGKSNSGFILCLIGGITQILIGLGVSAMSLMAALIPTINEGMEGTIKTTSTSNLGVLLIVLLGIWLIFTGIIVIIAGVKMKSEDSSIVKKWAIISLVFAFLGLTGNIFIIIGGITGIIDSNKEEVIPQPK